MWFHGGAWMVGDVQVHDSLARFLANRARCAVISVDYRLAPEHRYPAAIDDAWAATLWAFKSFDRLAVGGDSAGGNLAAAVAHRARNHGLVLQLQLLVYPVLDYRPDSAEYDDYRKQYQGFAGKSEWGREAQEGIRRIWEIYVPDVTRRHEPDASPLRSDSFGGLAPTVIITAEHDILRGENEDYIARLVAAGVPVKILNYPGQIHGFYAMFAEISDGRDAVQRSVNALRSSLYPELVTGLRHYDG
ncbi:lipase/esterase [Candidatus Protofrankia californiensis]|uniref:Lipase/esterase n=1 Tax=Candidatus Protofrankia californiensis TaxID=1839754 RepID=A0A1C3NXX0_9ACTN|nr:lipase/esterase [Candidatus Protofrankia californiensis]